MRGPGPHAHGFLDVDRRSRLDLTVRRGSGGSIDAVRFTREPDGTAPLVDHPILAEPVGPCPIDVAIAVAWEFAELVSLDVVLVHAGRRFPLTGGNPQASVYAAFQEGAKYGEARAASGAKR